MSKYTLDQSTIDSLNKQFGDISSSASGVAPNLTQLDTNLANTATNLGTNGTQLNSNMQQASNAVQTSGAQIGTSMTTAAATTTTGGVAVGTGLTTTATTVTAGGAQVGAALQTAAANISASGSGGGGIFGSIGNAISGFFGFGGSGVADSAVGMARVGFNHKGGLAGRSSGISRAMHMSAFDGALRFHKGGLARRASDAANAGLGAKEAAIIAQKDEAILPTVRLPNGKFGVSAAGIGDSGGGGTMNVGDINITVQSSGTGGAEQDQNQAKNIAREVRSTFKGLIAEWAQNEQRPAARSSRELRPWLPIDRNGMLARSRSSPCSGRNCEWLVPPRLHST
ncbi:hypothetical protein BMIN10S_00524 [Bosea minatitlanensis]